MVITPAFHAGDGGFESPRGRHDIMTDLEMRLLAELVRSEVLDAKQNPEVGMGPFPQTILSRVRARVGLSSLTREEEDILLEVAHRELKRD